MSKHRTLTLVCIASSALLSGISLGMGQNTAPPPLAPNVNYELPNWAYSPPLSKFIDPLPGVKANGAAVPGFYFNTAGKNIPLAIADTGKFSGSAYYEIALVEYTTSFHSELGTTKLRGYVQIEPPGSSSVIPAGSQHVLLPGVTISNAPVYAYEAPTYLGPIIVATKGQATRIKFYNLLPVGPAGDLFIPTDVTVMGAGMGPDGSDYSQNRATLHLHGGDNPWISDGTAHQWITPAGQPGTLIKGVSQQNVPDMPQPGPGSATFYWPNQMSGRLMFYHDHAFGITRLNVYAGEAAGYLLTDADEAKLNSFAPGGEIPLIFQDKGFVNEGIKPASFPASAVAPGTTLALDPLWFDSTVNGGKWGTTQGSLWFPHVYMPNQNPNDPSGANMLGRLDYGAWFWPIFPSGIPPTTSIVPEAFMDTPIVNGTAYPTLSVNPTTYRLRILNACNDRYVNLQMYVASPIISAINVDAGGAGYTAPILTITDPSPAARGATALATVDPVTGAITGVELVTVGSGYTAPVVNLADPTGGGAKLNPVLYTGLTEVGMVPASKIAGITFPSWWQANDTPGMIPNVLDSRQGGIPDPATIGPSFIHIGSEGGLSPTAVELKNTPMGYEQNKRSVTVLNTYEHTLFLGPAERADVLVDFSQFAGKTLIVYNDAPAPLPAGDPRYDFYTCDPDNTSQGGAPSTLPGFGPNTRTMMQITVGANGGSPALNVAALNTAVATAFAKTQPAAIVPANTYARISDTSMTFAGSTIPLQPKTIQELFDPLGRMNATLGVELPFTTATIQTTIPYGFADPATEVIPDGTTQLWKITHNGVDTHAIHFHLFNVQVVNRVGWDGAIKPPWPEELGWKDTVKMNPLEDIVVALTAKTPTVPFLQPNNIRTLDVTVPTNSLLGNFLGVDPNGNPVTVSNLLANFGDEYTWHCHLLGHEENDMMRPISVAKAPRAPALNGFTVTKGNAVLSWTDASPDETAYMVQKKTGTGPWVTIATVPAGTLTYTDPNYKGNTGTAYQVIAVNTVGSGVPGFPSLTAYSLPSNVAAAPLGSTVISSVTQALAVGSPVVIKWTYSAADQTGFTIQRSTSNTFPANGTATFTVGKVLTFNDTTVVTGLKKSTTYYYRVTPLNANGSGAPSNIGSLLVHP